MQAFRFPLESVLNYRRLQAGIEKARLQELFAELSSWADRQTDLERQKQDAYEVTRQSGITATDLHAWDNYSQFVLHERARLEARKQECQRRIAAQQQKVTEAERKYELLNHLKTKKREEWNKLVAAEVEALAAEAYLAKWVRERN
jgi:flagellar export protein FliJ